MREPAAYPAPGYRDPNDRRIVQIIRPSKRANPRSVNVLGVPFDGAVLGRKGAKAGPAAIRRAMAGFSNYDVELGLGLEHARIFDLGDVVVENDDVNRAHSEIESEVLEGLEESSLLVIMGGDNSISLPSLRACSRKFGELGLVVIDSHFDLRGEIGGRPTSGSSYGLAIETLDRLDPHRVVELGIHGFLNSKAYFDKAKRLGITVLTAKDIGRRGPKWAAREAYGVASKGADAVYLSVDLDALDLAYVSGVSAPSAGGLTADELFALTYEISKRKSVKCADMVELAPSLDPTERSDRVAATALMYLMAGFVSRSRN